MPYITKEEYKELIGEEASEDIEQLIYVAEAVVDAYTLYGYAGRELSTLPEFIVQKLKQAVAWQVQYVQQLGGVSGANSADYGSIGLGQFNYSRGGTSRQNSSASAASRLPLSEAAAVNIPLLVAYVRGLRS